VAKVVHRSCARSARLAKVDLTFEFRLTLAALAASVGRPPSHLGAAAVGKPRDANEWRRLSTKAARAARA